MVLSAVRSDEKGSSYYNTVRLSSRSPARAVVAESGWTDRHRLREPRRWQFGHVLQDDETSIRIELQQRIERLGQVRGFAVQCVQTTSRF